MVGKNKQKNSDVMGRQKAQKRANETAEDLRRQIDALRVAVRRANEAEEETLARRRHDAKRKVRKRVTETVEETLARRIYEKERMARYRSNEREEKTLARRRHDAERKVQKKAFETEEETLAGRMYEKERKARKRATEMEEESLVRKMYKKDRKAQKLLIETEEETLARRYDAEPWKNANGSLEKATLKWQKDTVNHVLNCATETDEKNISGIKIKRKALLQRNGTREENEWRHNIARQKLREMELIIDSDSNSHASFNSHISLYSDGTVNSDDNIFAVEKLSRETVASYSCNKCQSKFVEPSSLMLHRKVHIKEKPFGCVLCKYRTAYSSNLTLHNVVHHSLQNPNSNSHVLFSTNDILKRRLTSSWHDNPYSCAHSGHESNKCITKACTRQQPNEQCECEVVNNSKQVMVHINEKTFENSYLTLQYRLQNNIICEENIVLPKPSFLTPVRRVHFVDMDMVDADPEAVGFPVEANADFFCDINTKSDVSYSTSIDNQMVLLNDSSKTVPILDVQMGPYQALKNVKQEDITLVKEEIFEPNEKFYLEGADSHESEFLADSHESKFLADSHESKFLADSHESKFLADSHESKFLADSHESKFLADSCESEFQDIFTSHVGYCTRSVDQYNIEHIVVKCGPVKKPKNTQKTFEKDPLS